MGDAVLLQLLRRRPLEMDVVALALAERRDHRLRRAGIDRVQAGVVHALLVQGVLEHRERLRAVVDEDARTLQLPPGEVRVGAAAGDEEAVALVDQREVHDLGALAALERSPARRGRRLDQLDAAVGEPRARRRAGAGDRELGLEPLGREEAARLGRDQRAVEGRIAREQDADLGQGAVSRSSLRRRPEPSGDRPRPRPKPGERRDLDVGRRQLERRAAILSRRGRQVVDAAVALMESPGAASRSPASL